MCSLEGSFIHVKVLIYGKQGQLVLGITANIQAIYDKFLTINPKLSLNSAEFVSESAKFVSESVKNPLIFQKIAIPDFFNL